MTTITLEIPDELANRLAPFRDQLPELLSMAVDLFPPKRSASNVHSFERDHPAFKEVMDFLISGPTPEQIIAFKISPAAQDRLEELLDKNRENTLTDEEAAELDVYEQINHLLILLKAHARAAYLSAN